MVAPANDMATKETDTEPKPTNGELAILGVLWGAGPSTVREVHDALGDRGTGYTTVLKLLQIMTDKGLVRRDESARSHVYRANRPEKQVKRRLVADLLDRAFAGSTASLVMHALEGRKATTEELREIRAMLDAMDASRAREK
jgi:predicted transcriptional regulator